MRVGVPGGVVAVNVSAIDGRRVSCHVNGDREPRAAVIAVKAVAVPGPESARQHWHRGCQFIFERGACYRLRLRR